MASREKISGNREYKNDQGKKYLSFFVPYLSNPWHPFWSNFVFFVIFKDYVALYNIF